MSSETYENASPELYSDEYIFQQRSDQSKPPPVHAADGWAGSDTFSVPAVTLGNTKQASGEVVLQIAFPKPGTYTIQFNLNQITPPITDSVLNPLIVRAQAEIIWTVKGNPIRRVIDVVDGTSISGMGEKVYVRLTDNSGVNLVTDVDYQYQASVSVAPGLRPIEGGVQPPLKMALAGYYGAGGLGFFDASFPFFLANAAVPPLFDNRTSILIPQNCGINSYYLTLMSTNPALITPVGGQIQIYQDAGNPGIFQMVSAANYDAGCGKWVPLVPGVRILTIVNNFEVVNPSHVIGSILFGVDG